VREREREKDRERGSTGDREIFFFVAGERRESTGELT
jgi:hypothetical protein